jgi:hypothetical protein
MNKKELINEYADIFNTVSSFIEANKKKVSGKQLVPSKSGQKINGFIASIFDEYGVKDSLIVLDIFSTSLKASLNMTSSSAKVFQAIFLDSSSDIALSSALSASRSVTESSIKIHYITTVPLEIGIRYLIAEYVEHSRVFCAQQEDKADSIHMYKKFAEDANNLLLKLNLPTNTQIDSLTRDEKESVRSSIDRHDIVAMAHKAKVHIDGNFKNLTIGNTTFEDLIYHYRMANGFVHMNPYYISADSKNRHFWLTLMVIPTMYINCLLLTKFLPKKKSDKLFVVLKGYVNHYKSTNQFVVSNWKK